jgi:hypothetical protein
MKSLAAAGRLNKLTRHFDSVIENAKIMAERLIERGECQFANALVANAYLHDNSKLKGVEWDYLSVDKTNKHDLKLAIMQHNRTNEHHPEYWDGGIKAMPRLAVAEMVCDWKARSAERGTSLKEWINREAMKRFHFTAQDPVYRTIMEFVDLLLEPPLKHVTQL